ncbi:hypothetical protein [Streptacidiphilus sp. EB103A]|uniref:hypothetical protein n=1 Tax=Streptacidiphilus sp. EB103A TaxID=3156275 RepID=UPI0035131108
MSNLSLLVAAGFGASIAARAYANRKPATGGPKAVPIDPGYGDPELTALRKAVTAADWSATAAILQPCRDRGDHARLTWLTIAVEDLGSKFLLKLPEQRPDDPLALTLSGVRQVARAWEARSGAYASQVSQQQFRTFHELLRTAEEHLYTAVELDPESATPWHALTNASRGLGHGLEVTRRRFEAGVRRAPHHVALHSAMLQQLCAKWGGSHEQMHEFARESLAQAPPGSAMGLLTATAHLEHWLDLPEGERAGYMRGYQVRAELDRAAAVSVLHPGFAPSESPCTALNAFAMAYWLAGDRRSAKELFRRIGDRPTRQPWGYAGNPGQVFARARQECKKGK